MAAGVTGVVLGTLFPTLILTIKLDCDGGFVSGVEIISPVLKSNLRAGGGDSCFFGGTPNMLGVVGVLGVALPFELDNCNASLRSFFKSDNCCSRRRLAVAVGVMSTAGEINGCVSNIDGVPGVMGVKLVFSNSIGSPRSA